jgi:hypothetical protein
MKSQRAESDNFQSSMASIEGRQLRHERIAFFEVRARLRPRNQTLSASSKNWKNSLMGRGVERGLELQPPGFITNRRLLLSAELLFDQRESPNLQPACDLPRTACVIPPELLFPQPCEQLSGAFSSIAIRSVRDPRRHWSTNGVTASRLTPSGITSGRFRSCKSERSRESTRSSGSDGRRGLHGAGARGER